MTAVATSTNLDTSLGEDDPFVDALSYAWPDGPYIPHEPTPLQDAFLWLDHQEALFGGAAGGGKSDALLMSALQYCEYPDYSALILRKTFAELSLDGAIMDRSHKWLAHTDATWNGSHYRWTFPSGATLQFGYLKGMRDRARYQSAEYQCIECDELTAFEEGDYRFMFSRLRKSADSNIPLRMRSATNPGGVGGKWVKKRFVDPFQEYIKARQSGGEWTPLKRPFVPAKLSDNPHVDQDSYRNALLELEPELIEMLLNGNWNAREPGNWMLRDPRYIDACEELGKHLWEEHTSGRWRLPDPYVIIDKMENETYGLGNCIDWGEHTQGYVIWNLPNGGIFIPPSEVVKIGLDPSLTTKAMMDAASNMPFPIVQSNYDAAGIQALALDTPIPTPSGWTTMLDLRPGDVVFDENGKPTLVEEVSPIYQSRKCYEIEFDDHTSIVCDEGHRWVTMTANERMKAQKRAGGQVYRDEQARQKREVGGGVARGSYGAALLEVPIGDVRTTGEIAATLGSGRANHSVAMQGALDLPNATLPIHPYLLGVWLGDGQSHNGIFMSFDGDETADRVRACGYVVRKHKTLGNFGVDGLKRQLKALGVLANKHIPQEYLRASIDQRRDLLAGLMDSDGGCTGRGDSAFTSTIPELAAGFEELLWSLGMRFSVHTHVGRMDGHSHKLQWRYKFSSDRPPFHMNRKRASHRPGGPRTHRRFVVACHPIESVSVRCITVASESHQFLCGDQMVPTHNSMRTYLGVMRKVKRYARLRSMKIPFGDYKKDTIGYLRTLARRSWEGVEGFDEQRREWDTIIRASGDRIEPSTATARADEITPWRVLAIHPANVELCRQLRIWRRKTDESDEAITGSVAVKTDDHGPDALVAGAAPLARKFRDYIEQEIRESYNQDEAYEDDPDALEYEPTFGDRQTVNY